MKEIAIEDIYTVADNELAQAFGLNRLGEECEPDWNMDPDWVHRVFNASINDETVDTVFETMCDELINMGLLYTKVAPNGIIEVHKKGK